MSRSYILFYHVGEDVAFERFECGLDMDDYIESLEIKADNILLAGKLEKEFVYKNMCVRSTVKEESQDVNNLRESSKKLFESLTNLKKEYE